MFANLGQEISAMIDLKDARLNTRAGVLIEQLGNIGNSIPSSTGTYNDTRAAYRFVNHPDVHPNDLYYSCLYTCENRLELKERQTFLAICDTTTVNYSKKKSRDQLNCLNGVDQKGFFCHTMLLTDREGCPELLLWQDL